MPLTFTFALSQQQTFELRCDYGSRRLDKTELAALIDLCEQNYYTQQTDRLPYLTQLGRQLYQWLDGKEGWLRRALDEADEQTIYLDLIQTSEAQVLNPETQRVALGLAHLPWELLHDGNVFLLLRQDISVLPVRAVQQRQTQIIGVQNRPLRLLFMATAPEDPRVPPLGFEREEANILQATNDQPLALIVEESGSVAELANLVKSYPEDYFDVFHLTGHGIIYTQKGYGYLLPTGVTLADNTPCFITEDEVGNLQLTTVNDLAKAFRGRWPRVTFLSGCHTGQVPNKGTVPSMAQALVKAGAGMVLGWARPVLDNTGIVAAQALYQALATGATVEAAVKAAQQEMIDKERTDWHLLRVYRDTRPIAELVTPLRTPKREKLKFTVPEQEFLDEHNQIKVASRFEFVGRRRALQRCLRALRETSDQIGVFIAGMGGLGKSTLAARLCTRVEAQRPNFARVVLIGPLDEIGLLNKLSSKYERFADVPALLNEPKVTLKGRLQNFFAAIEQEHNQPLLLVLDDFEQNIPTANIEDGSLRMTAQAYEILAAICAALAENGGESRLIVTCRYLKEDTLPPHRLHLESLAGMSNSDKEQIDDVKGKATTLNNMAQIIADQGDIARAITLWEQSLEIKEQIDDVKGKSNTLNNMAQVIAQQGDVARALALWEQSLEISEQIDDVKSKAATLSNMAGIIAQQGDIARALALYEQSLEIQHQIGDVKGKAITFNNMAGIFARQGDIPKAVALYKKVASTLAQIRAYSDLVTVLNNLGLTDESNSLVYLAQAIWLTLRIQAPLANTIYLIQDLRNRVPQGDELEALLGRTAIFFCKYRGEGHPQLEELQERSSEIILGAARAQGIETQKAFDAWVVQQRLNDPEYFLPRLNQRLEEIVGDGWLFDRSQVVGG